MTTQRPERQGREQRRTESDQRARWRKTMTPSAFARGPSRSLDRREASASQTTVQLPYRRPSPVPQRKAWSAAWLQSTSFRLQISCNQILVRTACVYRKFTRAPAREARYKKIANADEQCVC